MMIAKRQAAAAAAAASKSVTSRPSVKHNQRCGGLKCSVLDAAHSSFSSGRRLRHFRASSSRAGGPETGSDSSEVAIAQQQREQRIADAERELQALESLPVKERNTETLVFWIGSASAFGAWIFFQMGPVKAQEYFAGYLLEQSLSIDNLFVFVLIFSYFKTPASGQAKILKYGIGTAAVLRLVLILVGTELIERFEPVLALFAAILLFSSYKLLSAGDADEDEDLADNAIVKFCKTFISATDSYDGNNFFTTLADGTRAATPLLLALAVVEVADVVFAVDSIPAVFGITLDPFIVYTSNIFAILSLRALYGFVSTIMTELRFLDKAVAVVLGFIGIKMLAGFADIIVPTDVSLLIVGILLGGGVAASMLIPETKA